ASSIARSSTTVPSTPRRTRPSRAWRSSSWASSATARRGPSNCSSRRNTRVSTTTPRANRRPRPPVGKAGSVFRCTDCGAEQPKWGGPGIGKSTLLLQCAARLEQAGVPTLYVSGEEAPDQIRLRAERLTVDAGAVHVLGETRLEAITYHAHALGARVVFVDSIQTTYTDELEGAPGNVGQVRECAARLMRFAKEAGPAVLLVGH